jgi:hypothetical protein
MPQEGEQDTTVQETGETDTTENGGQEPQTFDKDYVKKLRDEAASARTSKNELAAKLKEYEDRDKSEQQKLEEKATTAESRAAEAEQRALKFEVAAAKNVPLSQAHRLQGSTKEDLEKDADVLLADLGGGHTDFDGGSREGHQPEDMNSLIRRKARRG